MKKSLFLITIFAILIIVTGCTTSISFTYNVETGDSIEVKLNTSDGYELSSELPFTVSKDDETLSQGTFITIDGYNNYISAINNDEFVKVLDKGHKNGITYTFYSYNNSEFNYIIKVNNSNTGILLGNPNSKEEAEKVFSLLTFSLKK